MNHPLLSSCGEEIGGDESHYHNIRVYRDAEVFRACVSSHGGAGAGRQFTVEASSLRGLSCELMHSDPVQLINWFEYGELARWRRQNFEAEIRQRYDELVFRTMNRLQAQIKLNSSGPKVNPWRP